MKANTTNRKSTPVSRARALSVVEKIIGNIYDRTDLGERRRACRDPGAVDGLRRRRTAQEAEDQNPSTRTGARVSSETCKEKWADDRFNGETTTCSEPVLRAGYCARHLHERSQTLRKKRTEHERCIAAINLELDALLTESG